MRSRCDHLIFMVFSSFSVQACVCVWRVNGNTILSRLVPEKYSSGSNWDKSVIQMVKCSLLIDREFNQGFYDAFCTLS